MLSYILNSIKFSFATPILLKKKPSNNYQILPQQIIPIIIPYRLIGAGQMVSVRKYLTRLFLTRNVILHYH